MLVPLEKWPRQGAYPETYWQAHHLYRNRTRLGIADAFVRVGRRITVNEPLARQLLEQNGRGG